MATTSTTLTRCGATSVAGSTSSRPVVKGPCSQMQCFQSDKLYQRASSLSAAPVPGKPSRRVLEPCRVTNTSSEIFKAVGVEEPNGEEKEILVNEIQVHNPEMGILENRVRKFFLEELFQDSGVDLEETAYWFHTPPGGWTSQAVTYEAADEAPITFPEPYHEDAETSGRVLFDDLEEDQVVTGVVTDCWLYHGLQIDFGAEFDGLVPITEDTWMEQGVRELLLPGLKVECRVHRVRQPGLYRWPVQLELLAPSEAAEMMDDPDAYTPPINHEWCAEQGWDMDDICEATGRHFEPSNYYIDHDQAADMEHLEMAYGYDDPEGNFYVDHPAEAYLLGEAQERIYEVMRDATAAQ